MKDKKVAILKDNPELSGKKFFLCSMISPESRQKNKVYGYKIHDMCGDMEEVDHLKRYYHNLDPDFDIFVGTVGKWAPWIFNVDDIPTAEYANEELNTLVKAHRMNKRTEDKEFIDRVNHHAKEMEYTASKEAQKDKAISEKESCTQMLYRIKQLELITKRRQEELHSLEELYNEMYTDQEKEDANTKEFPLSEPPLMYYKTFEDPDLEIKETELKETVVEPLKRKTLAEIKQEILNTQN